MRQIERTLYFIDMNDRINSMLALELEFRNVDGITYACFFDTNRSRLISGELVETNGQQTKFRTEGEDVLVFRPATLTEYNAVWRKHIEGTVPDFETDHELADWYYQKFLDERDEPEL